MDSNDIAISAEQRCQHNMAISLLVRNWFFAITTQRPTGKLLEMLAADFQLTFPEATLSNRDEFDHWYLGVREQFFDQQHLIRHLDIQWQSTTVAHLAIWVNWQARQRNRDLPFSSLLDFDALQHWQVVHEHGRWRIAHYQVVELKDNQERNS